MRKWLVILGFLWKHRKQLGTIRDEIEEVFVVTKAALEDKKLTKDELKDVIKECMDVLKSLQSLLV